jgi:WD40 repeat protein
MAAVRRLVFDPPGGRLLAWVGYEEHTALGPASGTVAVCAWDWGRGEARDLTADSPLGYDGVVDCDPALSPDCRYLALDVPQEDAPPYADVWIEDLARPGELLPLLIGGTAAISGLVFTPDGKSLIAAWVLSTSRRVTISLSRMAFDAFLQTPIEYAAGEHPITGQVQLLPRPVRPWGALGDLPDGDRVSALGVSADSGLLAAGTRGGVIHVIDLRNGWFRTSLPCPRPKTGHPVVSRVGFDQPGRWVLAVVGGRLLARPLAVEAGRPWQFAAPSSTVYDFAFHPDGRTLAVAEETGQVHYLDPGSGAILQTFAWKRGPLFSVAFAPDGMTCAAGGKEGQVIVWDVDE